MIRVLDPATAVVAPKANAPLPTLYVSDELLVRGGQAVGGLDERVVKVLGGLGWGVAVPEPRPRKRPHLDNIELRSQRPLLLRITPAERPAPAPDAWVALQQIAADVPDLAGEFELNHVLLPAGGGYWSGIGGGYWSGIGGGYWSGIGGGYWSGIGGPGEYGVPGYGGKAPVALVVADPALSAPGMTRPPVVVMPDTGIGRHPWFPRVRTNDPLHPGTQAAPPGHVTVVGDPIPDDSSSVADPLTGGPARLAGHGTFIAGIIRQACPAARLESHTTMDSDGVIIESRLIGMLHTLLDRQVTALATSDPDNVVDVLSLSAGYYHESPDDTPIDTSIADVLGDLGRVGVLVVAGAGNDATDRPFLPAGLAGLVGGSGGLPLVSVGSLNPNGSTVALFSNAGTWVTTYRSGAAIVSTLPIASNAGAQSSTEVDGRSLLTPAQRAQVAAGSLPDPADRSTIDADDFSGGFAVWSGTSFATPVLAGQLAQALAGQDTTDLRLDSVLERGRRALDDVLGLKDRAS